MRDKNSKKADNGTDSDHHDDRSAIPSCRGAFEQVSFRIFPQARKCWRKKVTSNGRTKET